MRGLVALAGLGACACALALALDAAAPTPFSTSAPGDALPAGWSERRIAKVPPARIALVRDGGTVVLRVHSEGGSGAASHALRAPPSVLAWRWKVDRVLEKADMARRAGDDFAARVYVFFDVPEEELAVGTRLKMRLARLLYGEELPTAGLCYVWDNRHPVGTSAWNPYTDRIRMIVVESGAARAGQWTEARRDLAADFRAAFGAREGKPVPAVTGIAAGNDTDQTGEDATAWFGDFRLEARR